MISPDTKLTHYTLAIMAMGSGKNIDVQCKGQWTVWSDKDTPPPYLDFDDFRVHASMYRVAIITGTCGANYAAACNSKQEASGIEQLSTFKGWATDWVFFTCKSS